jgi:hypothetical protein
MKGSLQTIGWNIARSFRALVVTAAAIAFILVNYFAHSGTRSSVEAADARAAGPGQCDTVGPPCAGSSARGSVQCARHEAGHVRRLPDLPPGPECAPGKTRGMGARNPGGGPDD